MSNAIKVGLIVGVFLLAGCDAQSAIEKGEPTVAKPDVANNESNDAKGLWMVLAVHF